MSHGLLHTFELNSYAKMADKVRFDFYVTFTMTLCDAKFCTCSNRELIFTVYVSVNSKPDHPPGDPRGFAHSSCPWGRGLCSSVLSGGLPPGGS